VERKTVVSNEVEFEYWLAVAYERERKRLREGALAADSQAAPASERAAAGEKKKEKGDAAAA
jgi:hypothetical protein